MHPAILRPARPDFSFPSTERAPVVRDGRWRSQLLDLAREIGGDPLVSRIVPLPDDAKIAEIRRASGIDSLHRQVEVDRWGVVVSTVKI